VAPAAQVIDSPIPDGGEGTVDLAVRAGHRRVTCRVPGPLATAVDADYALSGTTAVIEMAAAAGLGLIAHEPDDRTARDGGAGLATALGARLTDADGSPLQRGGAALIDLAALDLSDIDPRLGAVDIVLASDVDNPLLGSDGAAAVSVRKGAQTQPPLRFWDTALHGRSTQSRR
jgi:glycerate 2-kinase